MRSRLTVANLLVLAAMAGLCTAGASEPPVELSGGATEIRLKVHLLDDLGVSVVGALGAVQAAEPGMYEFPILETSALELALSSGSYRGPVAGYLTHLGGFELKWPGDAISLLGFELHPGLPPNAFELRAVDGSLVFVLDNPHPQPNGDGSEYLFLDMDLRLSGQLAVRLGRPELEGIAIGEAHVRAHVRSPGALDASSDPAGAEPPCVRDFDGPLDVALLSIDHVSETVHDANRVALAPATLLQNVGAADVPWFRPIAPDGTAPLNVIGQHPYLVMHLYRKAHGRIEQIGRSDVKHAFFGVNSGPCDCPPDQVLFNLCTDRYGDSTNANRRHLAPRAEVTASTGEWTPLGSHFDGATADEYREHDSSSHDDDFEHRLSATVVDLETPGAEYRIEAWYLAQGDIDIYNSMGHRAIVPTPPDPPAPPMPGNPWLFPFDDLELTLGSALDTWVDPVAPPPGASNVIITTSPDEGELKLAAIASVLPSGITHFEYALMNFDFDRRIDTFTVPLPAGATVWNPWFGDGDAAAGADWTAVVNATDITWTAPAGNDLDWGMLFNFAFDVNASSGDLPITLGVLESGAPPELSPTVVAPATLVPVSEIEVALAGTGSGQVTSVPGGIDCAGDCSEFFGDGIALELSAAATAGSAFQHWEESGETSSLDLVLSFTVASGRDLTAVFDTCQDDLPLTSQVVAEPTVFTACESITAGSGGFEAASEVVFRAGRAIVLENGFKVSAGTFRAEIVPGQSTSPPG